MLCAGISAPLDDSATYLELYASADNGSTWKLRRTIAKGGSYSTTAIWEPNLLLANGTLICYYSDSRDSAHSQKLSLQYSTNGVTWSAQQNVVALSPETLRPGMPVVSRLANGNYFLTYEVVNEASDTPTYFQISSNPLSWNSTSIGTLIGSGGSPYNTVLPDGTLLFNDYGSGNVLINTDNGAGSWTSVITPIQAGYSRTLQYVSGTGRVLIMSCAGFWEGVVNSIYYADQDFGESAGAYYQLVNRNSGMVLGVNGGSLANGAQLVQWANTGAADQAWHVTTTSGITKFGNRNSGQVLGIWQAGTANGNDAVQWLDTGTADQQWTLVADGAYYKIKNVNSGLLLSVLGGFHHRGSRHRAVGRRRLPRPAVEPGGGQLTRAAAVMTLVWSTTRGGPVSVTVTAAPGSAADWATVNTISPGSTRRRRSRPVKLVRSACTSNSTVRRSPGARSDPREPDQLPHRPRHRRDRVGQRTAGRPACPPAPRYSPPSARTRSRRRSGITDSARARPRNRRRWCRTGRARTGTPGSGRRC